VAVLCAAVLGGMAASAAASPDAPDGHLTPGVAHEGAGFHTHASTDGEEDVNVCSDAVAPGIAHCLAHERIDAGAKAAHPNAPGARPTGRAATIGNAGAYDPPYLQSAYNLASAAASAGGGETVAIVDAFHDPNAAADLASYRSFFGLAPCAVGTCFRQVDEHGGTSYPASNAGWGEEISLDLDMVSAVCPNCNILLVEAASASYADLGTAVNTAASLGANAISNSYGGSEFNGETAYDTYYNHPGVAVTVSSGDSGYGVEYPASSPYVTAVGGTSLQQFTATGTRNATETAWSGAGSGCSAYEAKPAWQTDASCSRRSVADVSAVADPNTGVWVYDTYGTGGSWLIFGGTSVASPIIASTYALAGVTLASSGLTSHLYSGANLNDITSGSNGSCGGSYLCTATSGYDGPTGMGTPNTQQAFGGGAAPAPTAPGAPSGLAATAGNNNVALKWSAPSSDGGSALLHYNVYRWTGSASPAVIASPSPSTTSYTDTTAVNGTTYSYQVTAVNAVGEGGPSSPATATPQAPPSPTAPQNLTARAGNTSVSLSWSAPATGGPSFTYNVYRGTSAGAESTTPVATGVTSTSYTDGGLANGTTYYYKVTATNATGTGPYSNEASATPRASASVPGAPVLSAAPSATKGVVITWNVPNNGGSTITSYRIYRSTASGHETLYATVSPSSYCSASSCGATDTGTTSAQTYYYEVRAYNSVGGSGYSNQASAAAK